MRVTIDGLDEAIKAELENYANTEVRQASNESFAEAAKEAAKMLKKPGPYKKRTGDYARDWTSGERGKRSNVITELKAFSVYNKSHYQLTHLLEHGHQSRNGGRTRAFSHIATVNEQVGEMILGKITRKLGG